MEYSLRDVCFLFSFFSSLFLFFLFLSFSFQNKSNKLLNNFFRLDFTGGVLSLIQEIFDWLSSGNAGIFSGDPVKVGFVLFCFVLFPSFLTVLFSFL